MSAENGIAVNVFIWEVNDHPQIGLVLRFAQVENQHIAPRDSILLYMKLLRALFHIYCFGYLHGTVPVTFNTKVNAKVVNFRSTFGMKVTYNAMKKDIEVLFLNNSSCLEAMRLLQV